VFTVLPVVAVARGDVLLVVELVAGLLLVVGL
jgi:hypothetical protein